MTDNRDFVTEIRRDAQEETHAHSAVELYYVVEGTCDLTVGEDSVAMGQKDIVLVNPMERHSFRAKGILCLIRIGYRAVANASPDGGAVFYLNTVREREESYEDIRYIIHELIWLEAGSRQEREYRVYRDFYELMDILSLRFRAGGAKEGEERRNLPDDRKLQQLLSYVHGHYRESISLSELAKEMYVSTSSLSRFFRKKTNLYFSDYVNRVRLDYAVREMRGTNNNLTRISAECGFSSPSSFARLFRERYGISPNDYRKQAARSAPELTEDERKLREELTERFAPMGAAEESRASRREIAIDAGQTERCGQPFRRVVTMGSMSALTRANVQYHLLYAARELHVTHARIWSLFTKDLRVTDGKTAGVFNYNSIDTVLDMLVENHIGAYFDFGQRPEIAVRTQDTAVFREDNAVRFESRRAWESLLEDFVQHLVRRYGIDEVSGWYFDFNQDPSYRGGCPYYEDPAYSFGDVWRHAYRTIRRIAPGAGVGGPGCVPNGPNRELASFLEEAVREKCAPDFVSVILFPYQPADDYRGFSRNPDPDFEERMLNQIDSVLEAAGLAGLPVHITDWNVTLSTRNHINDSCFRGAYLASRAGLMMRRADVCCIWLVSDWVSSYFDSRTILDGGCGLLTRDSVRKPAWFALQFLCRLGQSLLYADSHLVVTARGRDDYMILAVNGVYFDISYFLSEEDEIRAEDVERVVMEGEKMEFALTLGGLDEGGEFLIKTRSVSRQHGSILDEWKRLRCETQLERADIRYLQEICVPHMTMERQTAAGGSLRVKIPLEPQEFCLLHIYRRG